MKKSTSNILITIIATLLSFVSVAYISCSKAPDLSPYSCENHVCLNGGYCYRGACQCPVGYEDTGCGTKWNAKFVGNYGVNQVVTGSDSTGPVSGPTDYSATIVAGSTPNSFIINHFNNSSYFVNVVCLIDSNATTHFYFQPFTPVNDGNFHITGGSGSINQADHSMAAVYYTNYRNSNGYVQHDTLSVHFNYQP